MPYKDPKKQKLAQHESYERNKKVVNERSQKRRQEYRNIMHEAKSVPCVDCGIQYPPYVMDFDHLKDKKFSIAAAGGLGNITREMLKIEIDKCEVVCANCHRERTYQRSHAPVS